MTGVINDPLGQTHSSASSDRKVGIEGLTDDMCENSDHF